MNLTAMLAGGMHVKDAVFCTHLRTHFITRGLVETDLKERCVMVDEYSNFTEWKKLIPKV